MQEAPGSASGQQVISQLQRALAARDYYQGLVDGVAGEQTAQAIFLFQMDCELPLTGSLNARILKLLHPQPCLVNRMTPRLDPPCTTYSSHRLPAAGLQSTAP